MWLFIRYYTYTIRPGIIKRVWSQVNTCNSKSDDTPAKLNSTLMTQQIKNATHKSKKKKIKHVKEATLKLKSKNSNGKKSVKVTNQKHTPQIKNAATTAKTPKIRRRSNKNKT